MSPAGKSDAASEGKRRVLLVDDHPLVREALTTLIEDETDLEVCAEAGDAVTALRLARELEPDLMIIDISLKEGSGLHLIKQIKAEIPGLPMVVSSMHDERTYAERCIGAGALGYVSKQSPPEKILEAIRDALRGKVHLSKEMSDRVLQRIAKGDDLKTSPLDALSDRELEVFRLLGEGLGTREIAEQLSLSIKTIDTYREQIKIKLGLENSKELIRYAVTWQLEEGNTSEQPPS